MTGAAVATTIGRRLGVLYQFTQLARRDGWIVIKREHLRPDFSIMSRVWRLSTTGMFHIMIGTTSWLGLIRILSRYGSTAIAGNTIGVRIFFFAFLPSWGMPNAAATMVGQGLGAGKPDRAERAAWMAGFYNMIFLVDRVGFHLIHQEHRVRGEFRNCPELQGFRVLIPSRHARHLHAFSSCDRHRNSTCAARWTPFRRC